MGKVKVVEIENDVPAPDAPSPVEVPPPQPEETQIEIPKIEEAPITQIAEKPLEPKKKKMEYVTCEVCNKSMLVKTYKYSHQKLCKPEPPPPPHHQPLKQNPKERPKQKQHQLNSILKFIKSHLNQLGMDEYHSTMSERHHLNLV